MKPDKYLNVLIGIAIFSIVIAAAALFFGYRLQVAVLKADKAFGESLQTMQQNFDRLQNQVNDFGNHLASLQDEGVAGSPARDSSQSRPIIVHTSRGPDPNQQAALKRLEQIVDSTGLKQLAEGEDVNPDLLQKIYDDYAYREQVTAQRQRMLEVNQQLHRLDESNFDTELDSLYQRARLRGSGDASAEERDNAFNQMIEKYPDAYATGMVIAERALVAAFRQNTADLENYYHQLSANENFTDIVTDRGLEAVPNIQYYLARQYINAGRTEEARLLLDKLEKNYADSYLVVRGAGRRSNWVPAARAVEGLRRQME